MREKFRRGLKYFLISFAALFLMRLGYGFIVPERRDGYFAGNLQNEIAPQNSNENNLRKNYASEKKTVLGGQAVTQIKEKYEKIGSLTAQSREFENDEKKLRATIAQFKAIVQSEQATGLAGHRVLKLSIGVDPGKFDALVDEARKIGDITEIQITKSDKTNEYRTLNAKRISQEKYRTALIALKGKGGKVTELIELEHKILEIEQEIQNLGVKLGDFDEQNEFCTLRMALVENRGAVKAGFFRNLLRRLKSAFEWTVQYYLLSAVLLLVAGGAILIFLLIAERLGFIRTLLQRFSDEAPEAGNRSRKRT